MDAWTVMKKLGEGGCGAVFKVKNSAGEEFAMKAELATEKVKV